MPIDKQNPNNSENNGDPGNGNEKTATRKKQKLKKGHLEEGNESPEQNLNRKELKKIVNNDNNKPKKKLKIKSKPKENSNVNLNVNVNILDQEKVEKSKEKSVDERIIDVKSTTKTDQQDPPRPEEINHRDESIYYLTGKGKQHPVHEMLQKFREVLLNSGFNELENQYFVPEKDVFQTYTRKSGLVLDKTFYLGETQKRKLEIKPETLTKLKDVYAHLDFDTNKFMLIINDFNNEPNLQKLFLRLKEELEFSNVDISHLIDELPELKGANPSLTSITLRSKMDSPWMSTLNAITDKENFPLKVFSTGIWFKREIKPGEQSLRTHYGASCIIIDDKITIDKGKILCHEILERLGIEDIDIIDIKDNKEYRIHQKEVEIKKDGIKIGTCGLFSKKILENFKIESPVLYINFGIEHLVMAQKNIDDIRELVYPQFHSAWKLDDSEIAKAIQFKQSPKTELGAEIAKRLYNTCITNNNAQSPCEFIVWKGPITLVQTSVISDDQNVDETLRTPEKQLTVKVVRKDKGSHLCGPAMLNEIVVKNGDILGVQNPGQNPELTGAVRTKINFLKAFSKFVGSEIENKIASGKIEELANINTGIIKSMEDINLQLDGRAVRYISSNNKEINVRGPLFVSVEFDISTLDEPDPDAVQSGKTGEELDTPKKTKTSGNCVDNQEMVENPLKN
jgi:O-phosphoseryl-tRNA synthetase